jgi:hypothetical protein
MSHRARSRSRRRAGTIAVTLLCVSVGLTGACAVAWGLYTDGSASPANELVAAPDWVAPSASASVIGKSQGGIPGYIRQGGTYNVYAGVTDSGGPASGVASVVTNVGSATTGQTATSLPPGSFSIGGTAYGFRTASLTANATLAAGTYGYSLTSVDGAGNSRAQSGYTVVVDNTVPTASNVQTTNKSGNIAGRPDIGDTVVLTFSEPIDPNSVIAGWSGAATNVVVRIDNNTPTNDRLAIYNATNSTQLALGTVNLGRNDYVSANATFGSGGTASTMVMSAATITVTLGTASSGPTTATSTGSMIWSPSASAYDWAGNAESATTRTETGTADRDF